jgi:N utilization substance protein B
VQALFQSEQTGESAEVVIAQFVQHRLGGPGYEEGGVPEADVPLFAGIVRSAAQRGDALDQAVMARRIGRCSGWIRCCGRCCGLRRRS